MEKAVILNKTNRTRHWAVQVGIGVLAYLLAYGAASYAIDRGSVLAYVLSFVLLVVGSRVLVLAVRDSWRKRK